MAHGRTIDAAFEAFIDQLGLQRDRASLRIGLKHLTRSCGFESYAYVCNGGAESIAISDYDEGWQALYAAQNFNQIDPVVIRARRFMRPFAWSSDDPDFTGGRHRHFFDQSAHFGIRSGLTIPVPASYGRFALLTLASPEVEAGKSVSLDNPVTAVTAAAFLHAHLKDLDAVKDFASTPSLTYRQIACLNWASLGKTMSEIGVLMGISPNTVRFHLDLTKERLGAANLPHAIRIALQKRLI